MVAVRNDVLFSRVSEAVMDDNKIPISLVLQWVYCPRRAWLEAVGERTDTYQMQVGYNAHRNVDDRKTERAGEVRALEVSSEELGLSGKLDSVFETDEGFEIIEYKSTPVKRSPEVTQAMRIQLALQKICLEESGHNVSGTAVFFASHHRRVVVELDQNDFDAARNAVKETRNVVADDFAPPPLEDDFRCDYCSHAGVCLPEERKLQPVSRRIRVSDPDGQVVHLANPGAYAKVRQGQMIVTKGDETLAKIPLESVQALEIHGNVNVSGGLIRELLWRNVNILWCTGSGKLTGWAVSSCGPNGKVRVDQHVASHEGRLDLAREFISSKIANQATQLRRGGVDKRVIAELRKIQSLVGSAERWQDVLGYEGDAASVYFESWPLLLKETQRDLWTWHGRSGRPAKDALNAMLNYVYSLLLADTVRAIISCGLDPHAGFLHSAGRNKPALALDLMEEFRAPIADSVVQTVVNNGEIRPTQFTDVLGSVRMQDAARKTLISAYERRMAMEIRHPIFGYSVTWRRCIEIQARQVLGVLDGSQPFYKGIHVR